MLVTVGINTWNRAELLDQTLAAFGRLRIPVGVHWHLLVVNNNCTDHTDEVVKRHSAQLPIHYIHENRQGTSFAKNTILDHANGDFILWADDDVLVDEGWMQAHLDASIRFPDATIFGGTVRPWFAVNPPAWIARNLPLVEGALALVDRGPDIREMLPAELVVGANMGFRSAAVKNYRFDVALGDVGSQMRKGEETELIARMRRDGHRALWVGSAVVQHYVPANRMTRRYIHDWYEALGSTYARTEPQHYGGIRWFGVPRWIWRQTAQLWAKRLLQTCLFRSGAFKTSLDQAILAGMRRELKAQSTSLPRGDCE